MRAKNDPQMTFFEGYADHTMGRELEAISDVLDQFPEFLDWIIADLCPGGLKNTGRPGMSVESILRVAVVKKRLGCSFRELEFHLADSRSFHTFSRLHGVCPDFTVLQRHISNIQSTTWERINRCIIRDAAARGIEKGRIVRGDSTVTETHIHRPSDSSLIWDSVRVMDRLMGWIRERYGKKHFVYHNHTRIAKKLDLQISVSRSLAKKKKAYKRLLNSAGETVAELNVALNVVTRQIATDPEVSAWVAATRHYLPLIVQVMSQTKRRVVAGEEVPASEKTVSLFEEHTDIIVKGRREVQFGHKVNLTSGRSGMILDMLIEEGNPADATRVIPLLERQTEIFGRPPRQMAFDGCYTSKENLAKAKELGVKDIAFHKKRGLKIRDMAKSEWVYKKLRAFRAGIEGNIGTLKTKYGFRRCNWKGFEHFKSWLWGHVVVYNLFHLVRLEANVA